ncbi:pre-peptidase C-terminal domain-containing protein [Pseudoalteromonas tunicata]|uniref:pre-peptidase C-terminal domain-containing protein n=1 Tax=Pseudoalteromonas tunicata TaxID=314281 RepID=UPI00273FF803|nr:pre-peptidase C-terminal domain-containing protein [Pseudoalteromonas tunicata]MDP4984327.1 pre-peptidase C-terminal domain-containing protein [Pseudoalteromonas tunicata]
MTLRHKSVLAIALLALAGNVYAGSKQHRLIWDTNPSSQATIGFSPSGSQNHQLKYGFDTNEQNWSTKPVTMSRTFAGSLVSHFVKLTNLPSNSSVYYRICDDSGCGERLWFKTAPTDNSPFVMVAGGDTRTGWTTRRQGNSLIAKIRPLFIMHGGDYTNANSASEMNSYLDDWQLTFSNDNIAGTSYKRIYPFIATHGNHEDNNFNTLCEVFGVDYDNNGQCNANDTFGAVKVSPLLKVYTLNSQFQNSGWASYASAMNTWLQQDLAANGSSVKWRFAQYHKPMYPHYTGKSDNTTLYNWWANHFYTYGMNLVVESDTHINKLTKAIKPSGSGFVETTSGGTVFVGEGSWGAPARSANNPRSWTLDLASIQQFKVISVTSDALAVRTAQFGSGAQTLSREQRAQDSLVLPDNVDWWLANGIGEVLPLIQTASGKTIIDTAPTDPTDPVDPPSSELINNQAVTNLTANKGQQLAFTFKVPAGAQNLSFSTRGGSGDVDLYIKFNVPATTNNYDCRPYEHGNAESCVVSNIQTGTYHVMLNAYSTFSGVSLVAKYDNSDSGGEPGGSDSFNDLSATADNWLYKSISVPSGVSKLTVTMSGGSGDADLYVQSDAQPTSSNYQCRPYKNGNSETCTINNPAATDWFFGIFAYKTFTGVTLSYRYE